MCAKPSLTPLTVSITHWKQREKIPPGTCRGSFIQLVPFILSVYTKLGLICAHGKGNNISALFQLCWQMRQFLKESTCTFNSVLIRHETHSLPRVLFVWSKKIVCIWLILSHESLLSDNPLSFRRSRLYNTHTQCPSITFFFQWLTSINLYLNTFYMQSYIQFYWPINPIMLTVQHTHLNIAYSGSVKGKKTT